MSIDTIRLNDPLVFFGSEGSSLNTPLSSFTKNYHDLSLFFNTAKGPLFANVLLH